jgi:DNA-binding response OmpR family regulator
LHEVVLEIGTLHIDEPRKRASLRGRPLQLRPLDVRVLAQLAREPGRAIPRQRLADALWGPDATVDARAVDTCVTRIRRALHPSTDVIVTVRRVGYRLDPNRLIS